MHFVVQGTLFCMRFVGGRALAAFPDAGPGAAVPIAIGLKARV